MSNFDYEISPIAKYRSGSPTDPYVEVNEQHKIINQRVQLSEIPVKGEKILISGYVEVPAHYKNKLEAKQYRVDYIEGIIHFALEAEGLTVTVEYKGRGVHYISADRVWTKENNGEVIETLQNIIDAGSEAIGNLEQANEAIERANQAITNVNNTNDTVKSQESERVTAESQRATAEEARKTAEDNRVSAETTRNNQEETRQLNEATRQSQERTRVDQEGVRESNEAARQSQEAKRQSDTTTAINQTNAARDAANTAANKATDVANRTGHKGEYSPTVTYSPNNVVSYNGSSYMCIVSCKGILPTDTTKWKLVAQKGLDGTGAGTVLSVTSANSDIRVDNSTDNPVLTLNTGEGANQIVKRDKNGNISGVNMDEVNGRIDALSDKVTSIETKNAEQDTAISDNTALIDQHIADAVSHITAKERTAWNAKETTDGAQAKATKALNDAKTYVDNYVKESAAKDITLPIGLSVVESEQETPITIDGVQGRTLVNLLGRKGACDQWLDWSQHTATRDGYKFSSSNGVITITTTKDSTRARIASSFKYGVHVTKGKSYIALARVKASSVGLARIYFGGSPEGTNVTTEWETISAKVTINTEADAWFVVGDLHGTGTVQIDDARLYEITTAEFTALEGVSNADRGMKYPYSDGMMNVVNPYVDVVGANLLPPFTEWTLYPSVTTLEASYIAVSKPTADALTSDTPLIPLVVGQKYTLSCESIGASGQIIVVNKAKNAIVASISGESNVSTFTATENGCYARIQYADGFRGTVTYKKPMLVVGSKAKPFKPQQKSLWAVETQLAANPIDGSYADVLYTGDDGLPYVIEKWNKFVLDDSFNWVCGSSNGSFKIITVDDTRLCASKEFHSLVCTKYDGSKLTTSGDMSKEDNAFFTVASGNKTFWLSISNMDSGWGNNYTPTTDEIKAYFMGWKLGNASGGLYNGSGTKYWTAIYEFGVGVTTTTTTLPTMPTYYGGWTPYKLQYLKATPTVAPVKNYELGAMLSAGDNVVEVSSGIVIREKTKPQKGDSGEGNINNAYLPSTMLKHTTNVSSARVFRNGSRDITWLVKTNNVLQCNTMNYDPTANYHVTYTMLSPTLSSPLVGTVSTNISGVVDDAIQNIKELSQRVSVIENKKADVDAPSRIAPTLLNGWNYTGDSRRSFYIKEGNRVFVSLAIYNGIKTKGTVLTKIPYKLDSFVAQDHVGVTFNSETDIEPVGFIHGLDGSISIGACNNGTSKTYIFAEFSYITKD